MIEIGAKNSKIEIRPKGERVILIINDLPVMEIDYKLAKAIGESLIRQSRVAAFHAIRERSARDLRATILGTTPRGGNQ